MFIMHTQQPVAVQMQDPLEDIIDIISSKSQCRCFVVNVSFIILAHAMC